MVSWLMLFFAIPGFSQEIFETIQAGNLETVKALLKTDPDLLNSTRKNGDTPLHYAAAFSDFSCDDSYVAGGLFLASL